METAHQVMTMLITFDPDLFGIVGLSLRVSLAAVAFAALIGAPLGAALAIWRFPGRRAILLASSTLMGLPPVVVGLCVYLMLSRAGPLGEFGLLFTPTAMIAAQTILVAPIVTTLTHQAVRPLAADYADLLSSVGAGPRLRLTTLLWDARFAVATALLAGFGRAVAEVGAVLIVGGNINGHTRVMTTAIAMETSKGALELALSLGVVLLLLSLLVNAATLGLTAFGRRYETA
ncbi:MAG: ABC transporter permease [Pseudomonadota bacterium]